MYLLKYSSLVYVDDKEGEQWKEEYQEEEEKGEEGEEEKERVVEEEEDGVKTSTHGYNRCIHVHIFDF